MSLDKYFGKIIEEHKKENINEEELLTKDDNYILNNLKDSYYAIADGVSTGDEIVKILNMLSPVVVLKHKIDIKKEVKIYSEIAKLLDKSSLGKFL